jgi:arylsulfatase A-like enzyme
MDTELGRLLAGVDRDNTVIIYLSDNGTRDNLNQEIYPQGHAKGTLGEGGVHVPMIIAGPGIPQGDVTEMVHAADVFATIIELAGAEVPADLEHDSVSLVPYLQDPDAGPQRELMLTELFGDVVPETLAGRAARTTEFKLIRLFTGEERLYNLRLDPTEQHDLMLSPLTSESRAAARFLGDYLDLIEAQADL